jgi:hypothetical protein
MCKKKNVQIIANFEVLRFHRIYFVYTISDKFQMSILLIFINNGTSSCRFLSPPPLALQPTLGPWPTSMKLSVSLQFTRSWTFDRTPWMGDQLVARPLPVHKH